MSPGARLLTLAAAVALLAAGRRLYWLAVGVVGFVIGFQLATRLIVASSPWLALMAAVLVGAVASAVAVFFQKLAVAAAGLIIGAFAAHWWLSGLGWGDRWWIWPVSAVVGFGAAYLTRAIFEAALAVLSSALGAVLALEALRRPPEQAALLFVPLVIAGAVTQLVLSRRRTPG